MRISDWSSTCALPIYQVAHRAELTREHAFGNVVKHADRVGSVERQAAVDDIVAERAEQFDRLRDDASEAVVRRGVGVPDRTVGVNAERRVALRGDPGPRREGAVGDVLWGSFKPGGGVMA